MSDHWELLKKIDDRIYAGGTFQGIVEDITKILSPIAEERQGEENDLVKIANVLFLIEDTQADMQDEIIAKGATQLPEELLMTYQPRETATGVGVEVMGVMNNFKREENGEIRGDLIFKRKYEGFIRECRPCLTGTKIITREVVIVDEMKAMAIEFSKSNADPRIPRLKDAPMVEFWTGKGEDIKRVSESIYEDELRKKEPK